MALRFDGVNGSYIGSTSPFNTTVWTSACWFYGYAYTNSPGGGTPCVNLVGMALSAGSPTTDKNLFVDNTGHISGYLFDGAPQIVTASTVVPLRRWTHAAVTADGTTMKVYQDGSLVGSLAAGAAAAYNAQILLGGGFANGASILLSYGNVALAQAAVWSLALSGFEIAKLAMGFDPSFIRRGSLRWHVRGDYYKGSSIVDSSPFGDPGVIFGGVTVETPAVDVPLAKVDTPFATPANLVPVSGGLTYEWQDVIR